MDITSLSEKSRILVVEDHPIAQKMARIILNSLDCTVDIAETASEATKCFQNNTYDLIFMDIGLPDKDGFSTALEIRKLEQEASLPSTTIIGLSVHTVNTAKAQALAAGMDDYLVKPMTFNICQDILKKFAPIKCNNK